MSAPKKPNPPTPVESKNPMSPTRSSAPEDPPLDRELEPELDRELDELLRELEPLDREPPLKDWPPPGRVSKNVMVGRAPDADTVELLVAARAGPAIASAIDMTPARSVVRYCRRGALMRAARRGAR